MKILKNNIFFKAGLITFGLFIAVKFFEILPMVKPIFLVFILVVFILKIIKETK